ncbi:phosphatidylinositol 4-kinase gamma 4, partial [Tanacetum coccineum]
MNDPSQPQPSVPKRQLSPDVDTSPSTSSTSTKRQQTVAARATATSSSPASTNQEYIDLLSNIVEFDKKYGSYPFSNNENLCKFFSEWSSRDYKNINVLRETINKLENRFDISYLEEESYVNNLGDDQVAIFNLWKKIWGKKGDDQGHQKKDLTQEDDSKDSSSKQYEASTGRSDGISDHKKGNDWIEDTSVIGDQNDDTDSKGSTDEGNTFDGMPRAPVPTEMGEGGALFMPGMNENESTVAVFKPMAKEAKCELRTLAGIRKGTIAGE